MLGGRCKAIRYRECKQQNDGSLYHSVITLKVNGLNLKDKLADWLGKRDPVICYV